MIEQNAKIFRDTCLMLALAIFAFGALDVFLLAFDLSLRTGFMLMMGLHPRSFAQGATILLLASIAFGVIDLGRQK